MYGRGLTGRVDQGQYKAEVGGAAGRRSGTRRERNFSAARAAKGGKKVVHREESRLTDQTTVSFTSSTALPATTGNLLSLPKRPAAAFISSRSSSQDHQNRQAMAPRVASSPSAVASTSRQLAGLLQNAAGAPRRHAGEAARLRLSAASTLPSSSSITFSSSSASHLSTLTAASPRRPFSSSPRSSAPPQYRPQAEEAPSLTPQKTTEELQAWLRERFPGVDLPDNVILQAATHESWNHGLSTDGHNRRLGFIGRRALQMFLTIFLHSNARTSQRAAALLSSPDALADVLKTSRLGDKVGRTLKLEQIMRWTPAVLDGQRGPVETGLFKIRGVAVEALVGAIYHQHVSRCIELSAVPQHPVSDP